MPLSVDNFLQSNTGTFEGTSGSASLLAGTTAGSVILIAVACAGDGSTTFTVTTPSGFEKASSSNQGNKRAFPYLFIKQVASADETTWTLDITGGSQQVCWAAFEMTGIDVAEAWVGDAEGTYLDTVVNPISNGSTVTSQGTNATATSESFDTLTMALFAATCADTSVPVLSGHTNGFQEIAAASRSNATRGMALSVAVLPSQSLTTFQCSVSSSPAAYIFCLLVTFTAADAKHAPDIDTCSGFEIGTATNLTTAGIGTGSNTPAAPFDGMTGSPAIVTTSPRTGNYCLELSATSAIENVTWTGTSATHRDNLTEAAGADALLAVARVHFYFPTSLPSGNTELLSIEAGSLANGVVLRYVSASSKLGVKVGTGTEVVSDATVAADTWIGVDLYYNPKATTHTVDWQVDYDSTDAVAAVTQTQASMTGMTVSKITTARFGWSASTTATVRYDDIVWGRERKSYPIGAVNVRPLKVDPAGTPAVSGTASNFNVFTNNGSMAAFSAASCRNALDDVPPSIGSTADGLSQVAVGTSDYVEVPMETYTAAPNHVHRALRWYFAGWAGSTNPATCRFDVIDSTLNRVIATLDDYNFDDTALRWITGMHRSGAPFYLLNQTKVDALAFRWGFSNDANPDVGIHCALAELVTQPVVEYIVTDAEDGDFRAYARQDPFSQSLAGVLVATPDGTRGATFYWTLDGSESSHYVAANSTWELPIGATDIAQVTAYRLVPDPTP